MAAIFVGRELSALVKANANKGILGNNTLRAVFREAVIRQLDLGVAQSLGCRWMLMTPAPPCSSLLRGSKPGLFSAQNTRPESSPSAALREHPFPHARGPGRSRGWREGRGARAAAPRLSALTPELPEHQAITPASPDHSTWAPADNPKLPRGSWPCTRQDNFPFLIARLILIFYSLSNTWTVERKKN